MRIRLVKFEESDINLYFKLVSNEKVMAQITARPIPWNEAQNNFKKLIMRNGRHEHFGSYKVFDKAENEFIGLGHLILNEDVKDEAEVGYMIMPEHWGNGYGTEIASALIGRAKRLGLKTLKAIIDPANIPSRKILLNNGFVSEKVGEFDGLPGEILSKNL